MLIILEIKKNDRIRRKIKSFIDRSNIFNI